MKILYCITRSEWGGAQEHLWELIKHEVSKNNEIILVTGNSKELVNRVATTFPAVKIFILKSLQRNLDLKKDMSSIIKLRKIIRRTKPDIVHLHSSKAGLIGRIACIGLKCKVIFTVHGWAFTEGIKSKKKKFIYRNIEKAMVPLTDKIIIVSNYDYNLSKKCHVIKNNEKAVVIHNGVSPHKNSNKLRMNNDQKVNIVMTARFAVPKEQELLIKAVKSLNSNSYRVIFIGDGPLLRENQRLAHKLRLDDNIKFVGFQKNVSKFLAKADIFVLTSEYEGLPISIIEAMNYKLPIIASNVGGIPELVKEGKNGFLINSEDELTAAIKILIHNKSCRLEMGQKSKEIFNNEYSLPIFLKRTDELYNQLLNK